MIYLTNAVQIPDEYRDGFGFLASAVKNRNSKDELQVAPKWMLDNDNFNGKFDPKKWIKFMLEHERHIGTCVGVTIPDKVGDALTTLRNFSKYYQIVRDLGYPVAFVTQDGITPEMTPWDCFDTLFIGGTTDHKLGWEAGDMIATAKHLGKWVHVGRVNSEKRIKQFWFADSVDGTQFSVIGKGKNGESRKDRQLTDIKRFYGAIQYCRDRKSGRILINNQYTMDGIL
jgi:hypothetical protein